MTEIYRDSVNLGISLEITGATVTGAVLRRDGVDTVGVISSQAVALPYEITRMDGPFQVEWTYQIDSSTYTRVDTHRVVTPLFIKSDLSYDAGLSSLTDEQVVRLESTVRKVIEAYTEQTFGYRKGYVIARGSGLDYLSLPERMISPDDTTYVGVNDGWAVSFAGSSSVIDPNIKIPIEEEAYHYGRPTNRTFSVNTQFIIYGEFGWREVPSEVKEAALILAEEFSCDESIWRDRYIKSVRAADWRFDFTAGSHIGTGSLTADQLLAKYVVNRMVVV